MSPPRPGARAAALEPLLHLAALWNLAVAQPLYDLLARTPVVLLAHHARPADVLGLAAVASLAPPILLAGCARLLPGGAAVHAGCALLGALAVVPPLERAWPGASWAVSVPLGLLAGSLLAVARARWASVRRWLSWMAMGAVVFPAAFLLHPAVRRAVVAEDVGGVALAAPVVAPVIVVVFDEFPVTSLMDAAGRLDAARYPGFAALARRAVWYRNATSVALYTALAIPAIVTGTMPDPLRLPVAADYPRNLFTLLGGSFAVKAFEPETRLCPVRLQAAAPAPPVPGPAGPTLLRDGAVLAVRAVLPRALDRYLPSFQSGYRDFSLGTRSVAPPRRRRAGAREDPEIFAGRFRETVHSGQDAAFSRFLDALSPVPRRSLFFLHVILPHAPWKFLPSGRPYTLGESGPRGAEHDRWTGPEPFVAESWQRHLWQVGYADLLVARLLRRLQNLGMLDDALLVVTADHGISFRPGEPNRELGQANWPDLLGIPLFIKVPGPGSGGVDDRNCQQIDILPTIADALHVALPWPVNGRSLLPGSPPGSGGKEFVDEVADCTVRHTLREYLDGRAVALALRRRLLADDGGPPIPVAVRRLLDHAPGTASTTSWGSVELEEPDLLRGVASARGLLPAWVRGRIFPPPDAPPPAAILVALNGTLRRAAFMHADPDQIDFGALLPEEAFRPGANDVGIFVVPGGGPPWRLLRSARTLDLEVTRLAETPSGVMLVLTDGTMIPVERGSMDGRVEARTGPEGGVVGLAGWAADRTQLASAEWVVAILDGKPLGAARVDRARPDIARAVGCERCAESGFELAIPAARLGNAPPSAVRVFAVRGWEAFELTTPP